MNVNIPRLLQRFTQAIAVGGLILTLAGLIVDTRWIAQPISTGVLMLGILALRAVPVRLSKYSYLTQSAVPVLVGAVSIGPTPVIAALWVGTVTADVF
ncbi:MAG: hypothetical protein ACJ8BF_09100, partial [Gemmatimonadales bacterium]